MKCSGATTCLFASVGLFICASVSQGAAALPRLGYATPSGGDPVEALNASARYEIEGRAVILPPLLFDQTSGIQAEPAVLDSQSKILAAVPEKSTAFLRLRLRIDGPIAKEEEKLLDRRVTDAMRQLPLASPRLEGLLLELEESGAPPDVAYFLVANLIVKAKGTRTGLRVVVCIPPGLIASQGDLLRKIAVYADGFGLPAHADWRQDIGWIASNALNKPVFLRLDVSPQADANQAGVAYLETALAASGSGVEMLWVEPTNTQAIVQLCTMTALAARFIEPGFAVVAAGASPFRVAGQGVGPESYRVFGGGRSANLAILVRSGAAPGQPKTVTLSGPPPGQYQLECYDPISGAQLELSQSSGVGGATEQVCTAQGSYALVFARRLGKPEDRSYSSVEVKDRAELRVEEIIASWQSYRESQRQIIENYVADCFMNLHFEPTSVGGGFDISMQFKQFSSRSGILEWVQSEFYVNGVKLKRQREFPLPQLEPEKVMTQPLELKLDEKYEYTLLGVDRIDGAFSYLVGVEPRDKGETLYSGKIWIDGTTYRQVRMELRQRGDTGNVLSNVETQNFSLIPDGRGNDLNLIKSIHTQQTLNAAGRSFILQKTYDFSGYTINAEDFDAQLNTARASDEPMYRDTEAGLRALRKEGDQRVVEEISQKRIRSILAGVLYEGTFDFPVPLFGFSMVDFKFRNTDSQLSVFFAGPVLATNLSRQWKSKYRLGLDVALSGLPENNRVYEGSAELSATNVWMFEESAGVRATWMPTSDLSLTGYNYVSYNVFRTPSDADELYHPPRNGVTLYPGVEVKFARKGYAATLTGVQGRRLGWEQFGYADLRVEPAISAFTKYSAEIGKTYYMGKFTKAGWEFDYYGGDRLDRFSRYRPSFLSRPRIRGIPSGTDSFDAIGIGSVNYGFNVMDFIKFEGFYNYARARNKTESRRFQKFDGLTLEFGTAGPWGTFMQGTVAYALHGNIERYNSRWGVYLLVFKPLR